MAVSSAGLRLKSACSGKVQKQFTVNYRPVLTSERTLQNNEPATVWKKFQEKRKIDRGSQTDARHQDRLADWLSVVN
jgi:hypothetical protein